jgi:hypothetical protein
MVWVTRRPATRTPSRRVVATAEGRICYSIGGDVTRWCQPRAFRLWIRRYQAVATRTRRPRSMLLRKGGRP